MSKYIDLEALKQFPIWKDHYDKENGNEDYIFGIEAVLEYAENLPAADAVPAVRCKDCKMRGPESTKVVKYCTLTGIQTDDDDFCSYGERKEGAE